MSRSAPPDHQHSGIMFPGITAQWHALVQDAQSHTGTQLDIPLESYLVHTLIRYTERPEMVARILALDYLQAQHNAGQLRQEQLRDVGDQCLLFAGLFPQRARRRRVRVSYYVDLGRSAYHGLSDSRHDWAEVYAELSEQFVTLMDTLLAIRKLGNLDTPEGILDPINAYELWQDTKSSSARETLLDSTQAKSLITPNTPELKH